MRPFAFQAPDTVAEALALLRDAGGSARPIAGGSDLLAEMKDGIAQPALLVSLARIAALQAVVAESAGLRLGAALPLARLEHEPLLSGPYAVVAETARGVATPEIRNQGTLGGNLCQRPRCLHYRSHWVDCLKKGGTDCPAATSAHQPYLALFGGEAGDSPQARCHAVHASDLAPPLLALHAQVCLAGPRGERTLALADFLAVPRADPRRENALEAGELVTAVRLPPMPADWRGTYAKARERTAGDFPLVSVAAGWRLEGGRMRDVRIVLGGVAAAPRPCPQAAALLEGQAPAPELAARAAEAAFADARPLPHNGYQVTLGRALVARTLAQLMR
jgi:xanthine dehydrogenase YagS FAD-binding subunit